MPARGGAEVYAECIRDGLRAAGDEVHVLTSSVGSAAEGTADVVAYGATSAAAQAFLQVVNPFAIRGARIALRKFRPDVALIQMFAYHLSPAVLWPLASIPMAMLVVDRKMICPVATKLLPNGEICTEPAGFTCWRSGCLSMPHWLRDQARYALIARGARQARLLLTCSRHMASDLRTSGFEAEPMILPVDPPSRQFRRSPARHPQFVFNGQLRPEKGVPLLVRAFARLRATVPAARLTICGDGVCRPEVEALIRAHQLDDSVLLTGWLDAAGVERHLEDAWALVAPTISAEPFGLVAPEAVVRGVPVIASRTGGFCDTVDEGVSGLLVPNGDENALLGALEAVAAGRAFPTHTLDPDVVARAREQHDLERHITLLRERLRSILIR
jgi:glycosyltransferase involved in cell wall biosynthesis